MTQEQKRIKIAEACGWKFDLPSIPKNPASPFWAPPLRLHVHTVLPDYFNDLNAMHEAGMSKCFTPPGHPSKTAYWLALVNICGSTENTAFATAEQHAEAFGKTLNLW